MHGHRTASSLALALLAATFLTPPGSAQAAPGDALGLEFRVNTYTTHNQVKPAVAMDADGDFVIAWMSVGQDGAGEGVYAQRFDAAGNALGGEFLVNTATVGHQRFPSVAMDADGDFVVTWYSTGPDEEGYGIFARRFDAAGVPRGDPFPVNTYTGGHQVLPVAAMDADGDFVVAWQDDAQDGSLRGIYARLFDAAGEARGDEFPVNVYTADNQMWPRVAMDATGSFIVAWSGRGLEDDSGVYARRFDAAGEALTPEILVNGTTAGTQEYAGVGMDADGDFVVAWESYGQDGLGGSFGVYARRFDAAGDAQGSEFRVNTFLANAQVGPSVAMDADGDFVVAWTSYGQDDISGYFHGGIFAQRYDAVGTPLGDEVRVNSFTTDNQREPALAMDADGDFVVSWESYLQDGSGWGVFAQRYDGAERVEGDFDGDGNADVLWRNTATGNAFVWLMEGTEKRAAQSIGVVPLFWRVAGTGDFNGDGKADILWRHSDNGTALIWQMDGLTKADWAVIGKVPPVWVVEQLRDTDGDGNSDIFWRNTTTGRTLVWRMSGFTRTIVGSPGAAGELWQVQ